MGEEQIHMIEGKNNVFKNRLLSFAIIGCMTYLVYAFLWKGDFFPSPPRDHMSFVKTVTQSFALLRGSHFVLHSSETTISPQSAIGFLAFICQPFWSYYEASTGVDVSIHLVMGPLSALMSHRVMEQ